MGRKTDYLQNLLFHSSFESTASLAAHSACFPTTMDQLADFALGSTKGKFQNLKAETITDRLAVLSDFFPDQLAEFDLNSSGFTKT
jgi:hypothetical protein